MKGMETIVVDDRSRVSTVYLPNTMIEDAGRDRRARNVVAKDIPLTNVSFCVQLAERYTSVANSP